MSRAIVGILVGSHFACAVPILTAQLIVAHRGASFDAPENTRASSQLAWKQGADAIEGDFYLTSDREIVCIHDDTTERVSGKNLEVAKSTLAELQEIDVGSWKGQRFANERIPSLREVLAALPNGKKIYIEIKRGPEIVPVLQRVLSESRVPSGQTLIISFHENVIHSVKKEMPQVKAYWLVDFRKDKDTGKWSPTIEDVIASAKTILADGLDLEANTEVVDSHFVSRCHDAGLSIHVWTVDDQDIACRFQELGVDSITTNRPDILRERLFPSAGSF